MRCLQDFWRDQSGALTAFTAVCLMLMMAAVGMGVDFMRQETRRAELQGALDSAVLSAASSRETRNPEIVIRQMVRSAGFDDRALNLNVSSSIQGAQRQITATINDELTTHFLKLIGMPRLEVNVAASATEVAGSLEVALVLDISTSMSIFRTGIADEMRLTIMKRAATSFVKKLLNSDGARNISISVIPFAGQVNLGPIGRDYYRKKNRHNYTSCVEFETGDFKKTSLPPRKSRKQMVHFTHHDWWNDPKYTAVRHEIGFGWCPADSERVIFHSNNESLLTGHINGLRTYEATGSQYGMRWAVGVLHPDSQPLVAASVGAGDTPYRFITRPAAIGAGGTEKIIVFMSDGDTTGQIRVRDKYYPGGDTPDNQIPNVPNNINTNGQAGNGNGQVWRWIWATTPAQNLEFSPNGHSSDINGKYIYELITVDKARADFKSMCDTANDAGINVFTIGFDVSDGSLAEQDLLACASSPGHFFDVAGDDLQTAFDQIGVSITRLRLTH